MALKLKQTRPENELTKVSVATLRTNYKDLAHEYNQLIDKEVLLCPKCGEFQRAKDGFYVDRRYETDRYPICKSCLLKLVEQRKTDRSAPHETKESVQRVLRMMDKVYDDSFYEKCIKGAADNVRERNRVSPWATYITSIQSLEQWKDKTWEDSTFGDAGMAADEEEIQLNQKTIKTAKKRFGSGYSDEDYMYLEGEYKDWVSRYECNTKAQEEVFENLSLLKLLKKKAIMSGQPTKDLDKQQQDWLDTGKLKPKQNSTDTLSEAQTLGTLIQKWEETRPLPDIDPAFKDVDKIGLYFDAFVRGHTSKMFGVKNAFSHIYEKVMSKFTVKRPQYESDDDTESVFDKIFSNTELQDNE